MRVLALNPYHGGSHAAFIDGWATHSRHTFTTLTLPAHHWKWRMRHAAATFAGELNAKPPETLEALDAVWCTSMLDLAAFYGLAPAAVRGLPAVVYFHENQLTYPTRQEDAGGRDQHFAITHLTSALAAAQRGGGVWWNSAFHRDGFLAAARKLLKKMPGRELDHAPDTIESASRVLHPGVDVESLRSRHTGPEVPAPRGAGQEKKPLHVLWVARWEHDKDPDAFFAALKKLKKRGVPFRLSVVGESFERVPECFTVAKKRFADEIVHWGYQPTREAYRAVLRGADVVLSTARHEFFGLAVVEAMAAGCFPVLPKRLAYPEVFGDRAEFFYDGTPDGLAGRLTELAGRGLPMDRAAVSRGVERYAWPSAAAALDEALDEAVGG
ncbi:MAG: DUF3524 domain-containing protein [Planctomycetota bacterium]